MMTCPQCPQLDLQKNYRLSDASIYKDCSVSARSDMDGLPPAGVGAPDTQPAPALTLPLGGAAAAAAGGGGGGGGGAVQEKFEEQ